jgi:hypothetical protein
LLAVQVVLEVMSPWTSTPVFVLLLLFPAAGAGSSFLQAVLSTSIIAARLNKRTFLMWL